MTIVGDVKSAASAAASSLSQHVIFIYEHRSEAIDIKNIKLLKSYVATSAVVLIVDKKTAEERRKYLQAGVNTALPHDVDEPTLLKTLQFISDYTFKYHPVLASSNTSLVTYNMPLWKRSFDIVASLGALILLSPLLIVVCIAIAVDSRGPLIYKSKRVGSNFRVFDFLKFRSMRVDADKKLKRLKGKNQYDARVEMPEVQKVDLDAARIEEMLASGGADMLFSDDFLVSEQDHLEQVDLEKGNTFVKVENDPRVTRVGRFIRKYSIDELPQLVNILKGDMSVVGNRPLPLYEAENLTSDEYIDRFMCPAGLTGLWQVEKRGGSGNLSPEERKMLDIRYAKSMSPWLDLKIIFRTFTAFVQKGDV